jgi:hypothetical protein
MRIFSKKLNYLRFATFRASLRNFVQSLFAIGKPSCEGDGVAVACLVRGSGGSRSKPHLQLAQYLLSIWVSVCPHYRIGMKTVLIFAKMFAFLTFHLQFSQARQPQT